MAWFAKSAVIVSLLAACDAPEAPPAEPEQAGHIPFAGRFSPDGHYRLDASVPLAYRRIVSRSAQKGDQYDNKRAADPENYTITMPPADIANTRPMTEWEEMSALVFAYPSYAAELDQASDTFVQIAKHASDYGEVWVLVDGTQAETIFKQKLTRAGVADDKLGVSIKFLRTTFDTYWFIDFGPLPLIRQAGDAAGSYAFADFRYYHERPLDDALPTLLARNLPRLGQSAPATTYRMPLTTEGGTFQATTDGVCITGSRQIYNMSCAGGEDECRASILALSLEDLQRHPFAVEMRGVLAGYAGCKDLIVTHSITDDGTGHIDMYLKILDDDRVLLGEYRAPFDNDFQEENAALMNDNAAFLEAYVKPDGGRFQVARLPMPGHRRVEDWWGTYDVPFTYINSTFFNGLNLWPAFTFGDWRASRDEAEAIWQQVMPDMDHVWIDSEELSYQSGAIHCVTRTIPKQKAIAWVDDGACADDVCAGAEGGYGGACAVNGNANVCFGPEWLCGCNDCRQCPEVVPETPCGVVNWRGCCDAGDVLFCENSRLQRLPCAGTGCGWDSGQGFYTCGITGVDPSGDAPASCNCEPACDGKTCGDDGCGGVCGACADDDRCIDGTCRNDCVDCVADALGCEGDVATRCIQGIDDCNTIDRVDCAASDQLCEDGACISKPEPEVTPEPAPEVAEAEPAAEIAEPSTPRSRGAKDDGCGGGLAGGSLGLAGFALVLARRRALGRRAGVRA